jgi:DNA topoisomerase-1
LAEEIKGKKKIKRVLFNAITKKAVVAAIETPTELDLKKYDSQRTRRILDRLVGYKISPILWDKVQRGLSAGRVQSVALRIITEREASIRAFEPEQWFSIHAKFSKNSANFEAKFYGNSDDKKVEIKDESLKDAILKDVGEKEFTVTNVKKRERKQNPTPPFTTSKLQQDASNRLGYTARKTMGIAQKLYEGIQLTDHGMQGLITYMRTDSVRTDPEALSTLRDYIEEKHGADYLSDETIIYTRKKGGKVQDAHEAIRPTSLVFSPKVVKGDLSDDELKLYTLIWNKFVSSQMAQAVIDQTTVTLEAVDDFLEQMVPLLNLLALGRCI